MEELLRWCRVPRSQGVQDHATGLEGEVRAIAFLTSARDLVPFTFVLLFRHSVFVFFLLQHTCPAWRFLQVPIIKYSSMAAVSMAHPIKNGTAQGLNLLPLVQLVASVR
ncbi:hypothetical protein NDU88_003457 [Pleurodeles waltl]|uniref:Uncharacterized protein n=1 Tax=Pleurodeles waltl TaxID=8319 RepID=A0AAV7VDD0_PLEWA|nr:hypothetical protein NDU88_003457 [Pleurodeles waltl]